MRSWIILIASFLPCIVNGQGCDKIKGKIIEQNGDALPGANVRLKSDPSRGTSSDYNGQFETVLSSNDTLVISFIGYEDRWVPVDINGPCMIEINLKAAAKTMEEVVVRSTRLIAEEFKTNSFSQLDIYLNPSSKADPILAVNSLPSATTLDESANISLRVLDVKTGITREQRYSNFDGTYNVFDYAIGPQYPHESFQPKSTLTTNEIYGYTKYHALEKISVRWCQKKHT